MDESTHTPSPERAPRSGASIDTLFAKYYDELRAIARRALSGESPNHTLQPTDLVHEAFARLKKAGPIPINDRVHFIRLTARAMRRHLVSHARKKRSEKGGGQLTRVTFTDGLGEAKGQFELVALGQAMENLERLHERQAWVIDMRYIGGMSVEEAASELEVSPRTVKEDTRVAMAFLRLEISRIRFQD